MIIQMTTETQSLLDKENIMSKHLDLPYKVGVYKDRRRYIDDRQGHRIADCLCYSESDKRSKVYEANVQFIIHACNNHYELLGALKQAVKFLSTEDTESQFEYKRPNQYRAWKKAKQAIAKVEEE